MYNGDDATRLQAKFSGGLKSNRSKDSRRSRSSEVNGPRYASPDRCPYHSSKIHSIDHNSPAPQNRYDFSKFEGDDTKNMSYELMFNRDAFNKQSLLYQSMHKKFLFTRPRVGDRADRVYSYYANRKDWNQDLYLKKSQEADHKTLQSREGRKLNLGAYNQKMKVKLPAK